MNICNDDLHMFAMAMIIVLILFIYMKSNRPENYKKDYI